MSNFIEDYILQHNTYDEVFGAEQQVRPTYELISKNFDRMPRVMFQSLNEAAKIAFLNQGVTFALTTSSRKKEAIFPFDLVPRVITASEWSVLEAGLIQRNTALNEFVKDVYHDQNILNDGVIPKALVLTSKHYIKQMENFDPPGGIYCHICGTDLIRDRDGQFYVLEDNLRNPSGVSYVLSNRVTLSRTIPKLFKGHMIYSVDQYPKELQKTLLSVSPHGENATCVVLTPGQYNSAYYEHIFLAKSMGFDLVEGRDLFVNDGYLYMDTIGPKRRVDVIYRRIDDAFLDPSVFRKDSLLGVEGLMDVYLKGNIAIVNAPGTGISDDKAICSYVPDMVKYYLKEDPIINNVPTYICERKEDLEYTLEHIKEMVVKPVDMSGGYGVTIVDTLTAEQIDNLRSEIRSNPREYIAQPKISLSTHATYIDETDSFEPRHIDLRTFTLMGDNRSYVLPGGLSRVALKKNSLIVNSSQGGGSKDTWVLMENL